MFLPKYVVLINTTISDSIVALFTVALRRIISPTWTPSVRPQLATRMTYPSRGPRAPLCSVDWSRLHHLWSSSPNRFGSRFGSSKSRLSNLHLHSRSPPRRNARTRTRTRALARTHGGGSSACRQTEVSLIPAFRRFSSIPLPSSTWFFLSSKP